MFIIYKASAGSGKTSRLVSEYLTLTIPNPEKFKHVLAITFTNNATAEMKERIVDTLYAFAFKNVSDFDGSTKAIYNAVVNNFKATSNPYEHPYIQAQSQKLLQEILYNYDQFSISTIDAFFQKILRAFAFELGINMNYNVQIQLDELHNQAISLLINKLSDSNVALTQRLTQLVNSSMEESGKWDIERQLLQLLNNIFNEDAFQALKEIGKLTKEEIDDANKEILIKRKKADQQFQALKEKVKSHAAESGVNIEGIIKEFDKEDLKMEGLTKKIEKIDSYPDIQDQIYQLYDLYQHIKTIHFLSFNLSKLVLLNDMQEIIDEIKTEENLFYLSDTNRVIHSEIKDQEAPYIYEKIGNKYSYFFIDEFQDTSLLQWENLVPLLINALSGNNQFGETGSVALFGDLKQAIYRFRNGDPELLKNLSQPETFSKALKSNVLDPSQVNNVHLDTNYRSTPSIIQFNNHFFKFWVQSGGMQELKEYYSEVEQKTNQNKDPGLVSIQFKAKEDQRQAKSYLIEETLQTILQLKQEGIPYGDMAVLMSGNDTLSELGLLLSKSEIPIISSESLLLSSSTWVMLLTSAVGWITNPDLPYYRMMVAHYFLQSNDQSADNLYDVIQDHNSFLGFLNKRGVAIHTDQLQTMHLNRIIYELLGIFKISKRDPYIVAFLDEVEQQFSAGTGSLFEFITWWTENKSGLKLSSSASVDAVTLSTIHKAKGLAYKVVIFAFSQYIYQNTKNDQWIPTDPNITSLPYSWVTLKKSTVPDQYIELLNQEKKLTSLDNLNKIYVAHTRARERLYIITVEKKKGNYSKVLWNLIENGLSDEQKESDQFWTQDGTQFVTENPMQYKDLVEENDPLEKEEAELYLSDFKVDNQFLVLEKPKVLTEEQEKGVFIHQFLASLTCLPRNSKERGEVLAGVPPHFLPPLISILKKLNEDIEYQSLLDPEIPAWNEVNLITDSGKILRPDRIVFFPDKTVVMDYKTGKPEPEHQTQIDLYCEQLTAMGYPGVMGKLIYL